MSCDIAPRFLPEPKCGFRARLPGLGVRLDRGNDGGRAVREARPAGDWHATMLREIGALHFRGGTVTPTQAVRVRAAAAGSVLSFA